MKFYVSVTFWGDGDRRTDIWTDRLFSENIILDRSRCGPYSKAAFNQRMLFNSLFLRPLFKSSLLARAVINGAVTVSVLAIVDAFWKRDESTIIRFDCISKEEGGVETKNNLVNRASIET